jgi:alkanesulfonate monooxygenase
MSLEFYWTLPASGDRRSRAFDQLGAGKPLYNANIRDLRGNSYSNFDYLAQVARAAELTGFDGVIAADGLDGDSAWIIAGAIAREVTRLKLLAQFSPGLGSAVYAAKQAVTFQRYSGNRFGWALATAEYAAERRALGDYIDADKINARLEEFLIVSKGVASQLKFTFKGEYFEVLDGGFGGPLSGLALPEITLRGTGDDALALSAKYADVHEFDLGTEDLDGRIARLDALAEAGGRQIRIALRARIVAHPDGQQALTDAGRAGFEGDAHTLVGDFTSVTDQLLTLSDRGVDRFVLHAPRSLEAAYQAGEHILPLVRASARKAA